MHQKFQRLAFLLLLVFLPLLTPSLEAASIGDMTTGAWSYVKDATKNTQGVGGLLAKGIGLDPSTGIGQKVQDYTNLGASFIPVVGQVNSVAVASNKYLNGDTAGAAVELATGLVPWGKVGGALVKTAAGKVVGEVAQNAVAKGGEVLAGGLEKVGAGKALQAAAALTKDAVSTVGKKAAEIGSKFDVPVVKDAVKFAADKVVAVAENIEKKVAAVAADPKAVLKQSGEAVIEGVAKKTVRTSAEQAADAIDANAKQTKAASTETPDSQKPGESGIEEKQDPAKEENPSGEEAEPDGVVGLGGQTVKKVDPASTDSPEIGSPNAPQEEDQNAPKVVPDETPAENPPGEKTDVLGIAPPPGSGVNLADNEENKQDNPAEVKPSTEENPPENAAVENPEPNSPEKQPSENATVESPEPSPTPSPEPDATPPEEPAPSEEPAAPPSEEPSTEPPPADE